MSLAAQPPVGSVRADGLRLWHVAEIDQCRGRDTLLLAPSGYGRIGFHVHQSTLMVFPVRLYVTSIRMPGKCCKSSTDCGILVAGNRLE